MEASFDQIAFSGGIMADAQRYSHMFSSLFRAQSWKYIAHHRAHAALGYHDSGFRRALVLLSDGGGDDGFVNAFEGSQAAVSLYKQLDRCHGVRMHACPFPFSDHSLTAQ